MSIIIKKLQAEIVNRLGPLFGPSRPMDIVLVDAPDHANVGDQAILLGELAYLRVNYPEARVRVASWRTYKQSLDKSIEAADIIAIHGGGNFGDIWQNHHAFRLNIMRRFSHKKIIQFPQSIHFYEDGNAEPTRSAIKNCRDYTLVVRDTHSFRSAIDILEMTPVLCPDMAFSMGRIEAPAASVDMFCLLRTDKEIKEEKRGTVASSLRDNGYSFGAEDWLDRQTYTRRYHTALRALSRSPLTAKAGFRFAVPGFEAYARSRLNFGVSLLSRGGMVVTDRLHGMIIATLIGRPRFVFDSYDGKIRHFYETWLSEDGNVTFFESVARFSEAVRSAKQAGGSLSLR